MSAIVFHAPHTTAPASSSVRRTSLAHERHLYTYSYSGEQNRLRDPIAASGFLARAPVFQAAPAAASARLRSPTAAASDHLSGPLRRGKWTIAEEEYTAATIHYFCGGVLTIPYGTTLRSHLAQQLHCDPMRISKKLLPGTTVAGFKMVPKIGRRGFYPRLTRTDTEAAVLAEQQRAAERHLEALRTAFLASLDALREEEDEYERLEVHYREHYSRRSPTSSAIMAVASRAPTSVTPPAAVAVGRKRCLLESELAYPPVTRMRLQREYTLPRALPSPPLAHESALRGMRTIAAVAAASASLPSPKTPLLLPPLRLSLQRASAIMAATR